MNESVGLDGEIRDRLLHARPEQDRTYLHVDTLGNGEHLRSVRGESSESRVSCESEISARNRVVDTHRAPHRHNNHV